MEKVALAVCGSIGAACFASLQAPQAVLNARRRSTEGLSVSLILLWHFGSIVYGAALYTGHESFWLIASMAAFVSLSATIEAQMIVYDHSSKSRVWQLAPLIFAGSVLLGLGISLLFRLVPEEFVETLGEFFPAGCFAAGFFPQFIIFLRTHSIEGYSFGITVLDIIGSVANSTVIFLEDGNHPKAWMAASPFLTIISLHVVLVFIAIYIVCTPRASPHLTAPLTAA